MHPPDETIAALSTPPGRGAIGLIRLSGPTALSIARRIFKISPETPIKHGRAHLGEIRPPGEPEGIDTGYLTYFKAGRSYTGEDVVEISTHGAPVVIERVIEALLAAGARPAHAGEFTYRALLNGRIDLPQAEGVRDLIEATTPRAARIAREQIRGDLSRRIGAVREGLEDVIARAEAALEFAEEPDVSGEGVRHSLSPRLHALCRDLDAFLATYRTGRLLREGARVVLAGRPNAGKSSLFNRLLRRERAIVAEQPGTTRDYLCESIDLAGFPVTLVDTAGLRAPAEPIEAAGVGMTRRLLEEADLVLLLRPCDAVRDGNGAIEERDLIARLGERVVVIGSKSDLNDGRNAGMAEPLNGLEPLAVSAKTGEGVESLIDLIADRLTGSEDPSHGEVILSNVRHHLAVTRCRDRVAAARAAFDAGASEEIPLVDLHAALRHLEEIIGGGSMEAIYDRIFSTFCIGK